MDYTYMLISDDRLEYNEDEALKINRERDDVDLSKSPDLSKLHPLKIGKTTFYYKSKQRLEMKKEEARKEAEMAEARLNDRENEVEEPVNVDNWIDDNNITCGQCTYAKQSEESEKWVCANNETKVLSRFKQRRRIKGEHTKACRFIKFK